MNRTAHALAALGITVAVTLLGNAGPAGAQEMEHGRTQTNQVKTQDAAMTGYAGYIRG